MIMDRRDVGADQGFVRIKRSVRKAWIKRKLVRRIGAAVSVACGDLAILEECETLRKKIFISAGILLALFGLVVGALAFVQKLNNDQVGNIVVYELPLSRLVADFDVDTIGTNWSFCERCVKILPTR